MATLEIYIYVVGSAFLDLQKNPLPLGHLGLLQYPTFK